jgi:hypothetical protein
VSAGSSESQSPEFANDSVPPLASDGWKTLPTAGVELAVFVVSDPPPPPQLVSTSSSAAPAAIADLFMS